MNIINYFNLPFVYFDKCITKILNNLPMMLNFIINYVTNFIY